MKILFIVQGEGRGHLTQAISMEKLLRSNGHEVVEVLVGKVNPGGFRDFLSETFRHLSNSLSAPISCLPTPTNG